MIKAAPECWHDRDFGLGEAQHEAQLALAKDWHQRIGNGANAAAGIKQRRELPPVRQLKGDDVALADATVEKAQSDLVDALAKLSVAKPDLAALRTIPPHECFAPGTVVDGLVEVVDGQPVKPQSARGGNARLRQIDFHGALSPGPTLTLTAIHTLGRVPLCCQTSGARPSLDHQTGDTIVGGGLHVGEPPRGCRGDAAWGVEDAALGTPPGRALGSWGRARETRIGTGPGDGGTGSPNGIGKNPTLPGSGTWLW